MKAIPFLRSLGDNCHFFLTISLQNDQELSLTNKSFSLQCPWMQVSITITSCSQQKPQWWDHHGGIVVLLPLSCAQLTSGGASSWAQGDSPATASPLSCKGHFCNSYAKSHLKTNLKQVTNDGFCPLFSSLCPSSFTVN